MILAYGVLLLTVTQVAGAVYAVSLTLFIVAAAAVILINLKLLQHRNWARIVVIIFSVLGVISSFGEGLPIFILSFIVNGAVIHFLHMDKDVKALFVKGEADKKPAAKAGKKKKS